ncbi:MAG: serpin family protein [Phycisphaerae bacterium]
MRRHSLVLLTCAVMALPATSALALIAVGKARPPTTPPQDAQGEIKIDPTAKAQPPIAADIYLPNRTTGILVRQFNNALYPQFAQRNDNVFYSAYSLHTALLMATQGAQGDTRKELQQVLLQGAELGAVETQNALKGLAKSLQAPSKDYTLAVANRIWVDQRCTLLPAYVTDMEKIWAAGAQNVDFTQAPAAADTINTWVAGNTNQKITNLLTADVLKDAQLVLTNAVYFKGKWAMPFAVAQTEKLDFTAPDGVVKVPMMYQKSMGIRYGVVVGRPEMGRAALLRARNYEARTALANTKIIELDYAGEQMTMRLALPPEGMKLADLNTIQMDIITTQPLRASEVAVWLPRLKVEDKHSLKSALTALGIKSAFTNTADFSGITGKAELQISEVVQKTFLEVNEEGTEAAAATGIIMAPTAMPMEPPKPLEFRADRPYLLQIIHRPTGAVLFTGRIVKPGV